MTKPWEHPKRKSIGTCFCGNEFERKAGNQKYCSGKCREKAARKRVPATCPTCDKVFYRSTRAHKYCSTACKPGAQKSEGYECVHDPEGDFVGVTFTTTEFEIGVKLGSFAPGTIFRSRKNNDRVFVDQDGSFTRSNSGVKKFKERIGELL